MKLNIRDFSLRHLMGMRYSILHENQKRRFTIQEINVECDRRARMSTPLSVRKDPSIYTP